MHLSSSWQNVKTATWILLQRIFSSGKVTSTLKLNYKELHTHRNDILGHETASKHIKVEWIWTTFSIIYVYLSLKSNMVFNPTPFFKRYCCCRVNNNSTVLLFCVLTFVRGAAQLCSAFSFPVVSLLSIFQLQQGLILSWSISLSRF